MAYNVIQDIIFAEAPLYFVRSGFVNIFSSKLRDSGLFGYYWSSMPNSNTNNAYDLYFSGSGVGPSDYNNRWRGFPLRCLAS